MWEDLTSQGQLRDPGEDLGAQVSEAAHGCFFGVFKGHRNQEEGALLLWWDWKFDTDGSS